MSWYMSYTYHTSHNFLHLILLIHLIHACIPCHATSFHCIPLCSLPYRTLQHFHVYIYYIIYRSTVYFYMLVMLGDNSEMNRIWMSKAYCTTDWRHLATKLAGHAASRWSGVKPGEVVIWHDMTVCWWVLWLSYDGSDGVVIGITWYHLCPEGYRFAVL